MKTRIVAQSLLLLVSLGTSAQARSFLQRHLQGFGVGTALDTLSPTYAPVIVPPLTPLVSATPAPTSLPTTAPTKAVTAPNVDDWELTDFTYQWKLYASSTGRVVPALDAAEDAVSVELRKWIRALRGPVSIQNLKSRVLGPCSTKDDDPFPNYKVCNLIETTIHTLMDVEGLDSSIFEDRVMEKILNYTETFNKESIEAKMVFEFPINVTGTMQINMFGVQTRMDEYEEELFLEVVRTSVTEIFEVNASQFTFHLKKATIVNQHSSTGNRNLQVFNDPFNKVQIQIEASCAGVENCTDGAVQSLLDESGPPYSQVMETLLKVAATEREEFYFIEMKDLEIVAESTVDQLPKSVSGETPAEQRHSRKKMPKWVWLVIILNVVILAMAIAYSMHRRASDRVRQPLRENETKRKSKKNRKGSAMSHAPMVDDSEDFDDQSHFDEQFYNVNHDPTSLAMVGTEDERMETRSYDGAFSVEAGDVSVDNDDIYSLSQGRRSSHKRSRRNRQRW